MIDLFSSGLPLKFDREKEELIFPEGFPTVVPDVRLLSRSSSFYLEPISSREKLYLMYRGIFQRKDEETFLRWGMRYDITVLFPGTVGKEFLRTIGHYHPQAHSSSRGLSYPEVYEVLYGQATYLLQKLSSSGEVEDAVEQTTKAGEKLLIPPGYGHVTVNCTDDFLIMANLLERNFQSLYGEYEEKRGPAYYAFSKGEGVSFKKNPNYGKLPPLRRIKPQEHPNLGLTFKVSLYKGFLSFPQRFLYLKDPDLLSSYLPGLLS